jgi:N-acetylmuramic acid 6-phosphate etherase
MTDRSHLLTELRLPESMSLDAMSVEDAVALMNDQDAKAVAAVAAERANVAKAVVLVADALRAGGRLIYAGAGTSGRLGVLDASECPPTFRTAPEQVQGIIAGGEDAMFRAKEGAEDSAADGADVMDGKNVGANDVVMGIASGGAARRRSSTARCVAPASAARRPCSSPACSRCRTSRRWTSSSARSPARKS